MNCQNVLDNMPLALYGELGDEAHGQLKDHVVTCASCAETYRELEAALNLINEYPEPLPPTPDVWSSLEAELNQIDQPKRRWSPPFFLAIAAAFVLGFLLMFQQNESPATEVVETVESEPELLEPFLMRSQPLLLSLANREIDAPPPGKIKQEQELAANLASEAARLGDQLKEQGAKRSELRLTRDLERIFLQTANLEKRKYHKGLGLLQDQIEDRDILFRITLKQLQSGRVASL